MRARLGCACETTSPPRCSVNGWPLAAGDKLVIEPHAGLHLRGGNVIAGAIDKGGTLEVGGVYDNDGAIDNAGTMASHGDDVQNRGSIHNAGAFKNFVDAVRNRRIMPCLHKPLPPNDPAGFGP